MPTDRTPPQGIEWAGLRHGLLRRARRVVGDAGLAEDLVQDTLLAVLQQQDRRRGEASLRTWSSAILKHKVADWYRSPARRCSVSLDDDGAGDPGDGGVATGRRGCDEPAAPARLEPEQWLEQRQRMARVSGGVAALPARAGQALLLHDWLGFETPEVCARLGVSAEHCRTLLHRARGALRVRLQAGTGAR